jgi:hypothetical protein
MVVLVLVLVVAVVVMLVVVPKLSFRFLDGMSAFSLHQMFDCKIFSSIDSFA